MIVTTTINHIARRRLGIKSDEYVVCDLVFKLQGNPKAFVPGWCNMSRDRMANELGYSKRGIISMIDRLENKGLIEKNAIGNIRTTSPWYEAVVWADKEKEKFFKGENYDSGIGEKSAPQKKKPVKKVHRVGEKSAPPIGEKSAPYISTSSYTGIDTCEETQHKISKSQDQEKTKPSPTLKSKPTTINVDAVNVATPIDYEAKAEDLITAKIGTASRAVKDSWVIKYGPQIKASGMSPAEIVQGCAAHMRLNDRLLSYLTGSTLVREIEALPARRFISFFQNKWLPNVRPGKPTNNQLQNPKVLPTNTTLQYLN